MMKSILGLTLFWAVTVNIEAVCEVNQVVEFVKRLNSASGLGSTRFDLVILVLEDEKIYDEGRLNDLLTIFAK